MANPNLPPDREYRAPVSGESVEVPAPEARQGVTRHNVRYVLAISLAGVVILFIVIYLGFFG